MYRIFLPLLSLAIILPAAAQDKREVSGAVSYRERMALPPDAELRVEITGFQDSRLGSSTEAADGREVPWPFTVQMPTGMTGDLRASILLDDAVRWSGEPIHLDAGTADVDLGMLILHGQVSPDAQSTFVCGDERIQVAFHEEDASLTVEGEVFQLSQTIAASGAKYVSDDGQSAVWNKGDDAMVTVKGHDLPDCTLVPHEDGSPWTAQGNEPGWRSVIEAGRIAIDLNYGSDQLDLDLPAPTIEAGTYLYEFPDLALSLAVHDGICADDMTGRLYPQTVELTTGARNLRGCGGDTLDLLRGGEWSVTEIQGESVPLERGLTIDIGDDQNISGSSGCNRFMGSFSISGEGALEIGPLLSTNMACESEQVMERERVFLSLLSSAKRFDIDDHGALLLRSDGETVLVARR